MFCVLAECIHNLHGRVERNCQGTASDAWTLDNQIEDRLGGGFDTSEFWLCRADQIHRAEDPEPTCQVKQLQKEWRIMENSELTKRSCTLERVVYRTSLRW